jgi:hypothetical protein
MHAVCFCVVCVAAGVIWRGDSVIDGVPETLDMLRAAVRHHHQQQQHWQLR